MGSRLDNNSATVRKRIEAHSFDNEEGEEYESSKFGGFPEYFRRKKIKLQNLDAQLRSDHDDKPHIFRGIVAHVNGYTQPSLNDLHVLIVTHGGGFIQYLDGKTQVTHIIASSLTPKKVEDFRKYRIVKPAWIVDSVNAGKLLPWENYRVVDEGTRQKVLKFDEGGFTSQTNNKPLGYRDQTDASWYTRQLAQRDASDSENTVSEDHDEFDSPDSAIFRPHTLAPSKTLSIPAASTQHIEYDVPTVSSLHEYKASSLHLDNEIDAGDQQPSDNPLVDKMVEGNADDTALLMSPPDGIHQGNMDVQQQGTPCIRAQDDTKAKMTAEDHNRELLSDPRIRKSSVLNPDFLEQYYRESRLHHLSTWKADLKSQLQALTSEKTVSQRLRQKSATNSRRYILHVDFDSFFVAVSLKKCPHLTDKPAVVAHGAGSGSEIASCNYAARKYGVKNGMWMKRAQELCDNLQVLPYDFPGYEAASRLFYDAIMETGGIVQSVSIDEALVDVSTQCHAAGGTNGAGVHEGSIWREQGKADEIAQVLRDRVKEESGCAVSVGIGGNILLAKVALRKAKPAGQYHIKPEETLNFVGELEVQSLPGVAYSIGGKLEEIGVKFVKDIRDLNKERLVTVLGPKTGEKIWNYARGIDRTEVGDQVVRKSVSAEVNWGVRFETQEQAEEFMASLSGELSRRLLKEGVKGCNLTMKVMRRAKDAPMDPPKHLGHGKCDIYNKSIVLGVMTNDKDTISKETISILRGFGFSPGELRGLGMQMTKLEPIKPSLAGKTDGSQRRLQFNTLPVQSKTVTKPAQEISPQADLNSASDRTVHDSTQLEDILDESARPGLQLKLRADATKSPARNEARTDDIQDDLQTPKHHRAQQGGRIPMIAEDSPSRKPLNTLGTQFILPTQVDPKVLAELPPDIRARLGKQASNVSKHEAIDRSKHAQAVTSNERPFAFTALPNACQIDPDILEALPADVRREILSQYQKSPLGTARRRGQVVLPPSPRKNRMAKGGPAPRGRTRGRPRGGSLLARLRGASSRGEPTLTQANFVAVQTDSESDAAPSDIAPDFLEALPEEMRAEVIENHRREQMKRNAGIEVSRRRRHPLHGKGGQQGQQTVERILRLELGSPRPTFTQNRLSNLNELREALSSWFAEFEADGPYDEDVEALCSYLSSVVVDEGDMRKAVDVTKWLIYLIDSMRTTPEHQAEAFVSDGGIAWAPALELVKQAVGDAVRSRGLGPVDFQLWYIDLRLYD